MTTMDYDESVKAISAAEAAEPGDRSVDVDVTDLGPEVDIRRYDGSEVEKAMAFVEAAERGAAAEQQAQPARKGQPQAGAGQVAAAAPAQHISMQDQMKGVGSEINTLKTGIKSAESRGVRAARVEEEAIAKELGSLISRAEGELSKAESGISSRMKKGRVAAAAKPQAMQARPEAAAKPQEQKKPEQRLVLPGLSLQDQITELEKIGRVLDSDSLTGEQIGIIKAEIKGLMENRGSPASGLQEGLAGIRDARLAEIARRLGIG